MIHLNDIEFGAELREERFGGAAVGAIGFGEDGCVVFVSTCLFLGMVCDGWDEWIGMVEGWWVVVGGVEGTGGVEGKGGEGERERGRTYQQRSHQ